MYKKPVDSGFSCALDLVKYIKQYEKQEKIENFFSISVAAYPEGHPNTINKFGEVENENDEVDFSKFKLTDSEKERVVQVGKELFVCSDADYENELKYLKEKVDAGANMIVTQMFYDAEVFISFMKKCRQIGIKVPIIPGIMCVTNYNGFKKMGALCKTRCPTEVKSIFEKAKDSSDNMKAAGIKVAANMCKKLLAAGVPGLHFYTLNLDEVVVGVLNELDLYKSNYGTVEEAKSALG